MSVKRHFTGKPIGREENGSSDDSELESEAEDEQLVEQQQQQQQKKSIKTNIQIQPIEREIRGDNGLSVNQKVAEKEEEATQTKKEASESSEEIESESEDDSDEDSSEEDSSDDEPKMLKPVFLSKSKRSQAISSTIRSKDQKALEDRERTLKTIEAHINQDIEYRKQLKESTHNYGGIDDTDDLDPEAERVEWELRQLKREERDRAKLEKEQDELEELENRRLRTEEERDEEFKQLQLVEEGKKAKPQGAFFRDEELLKRDLGEENEKYDKSLLPQRFKPEKL